MGGQSLAHLQSKEDPKTGRWTPPASSLICQFSPSRGAQLDTCGPGTLPVESSPTRPLAGPGPAVVQTGPGLTAGRTLAVVLSLVSSPDVAELASMRQAGLPQRLFPGCYCASQTWHAISPTGHRAAVQDVYASALAMLLCACGCGCGGSGLYYLDSISRRGQGTCRGDASPSAATTTVNCIWPAVTVSPGANQKRQ